VVLAGDGSTLFARRAEVPVAPASTLKLLVAASALNTLGPAHRFETRFVANEPPQDGTLGGTLWLVGGGDPSLTSDDVRRGVGALARAGIVRVEGALQVDDSAFSGPEQNPRWDRDDLSYDYAAGTSAMSLDEDTVEFEVTPDPGGGAARVRVVPDNESIAFSGSIATGGGTYLTIERKPELPTFSSGDRASAAGSDAAAEPHNEYVLAGHIAYGETQKFYKPVLGMPGYVGGAVAAMLAKRNIALVGGYRAGAAPPVATTLWEHRSPTLAAIVHEMLVESNNHTAETLLRVLGERSGHPGTDGAGIAFEKRELARLGVPHAKMTLYDGSGLAPSDRIMPLTLAAVIAAEVRGPYGDVFVRSLPLVGMEGTVKGHHVRSALGRARAKSGHIEGVNGLAGTVVTKHHGRIAFAFIVNDPRANADIVYAEEDRALDALADS
ncbi:MAG: D-alanyl-D-alanine carboxypeptidase/D-alanyl-D-alanine-endopeptidase, partial [Candidatus Eremiobacteraeota bacterium]|nr:D-alanyl-D-alanine carboxypeptidase/D-alanyl-D-alanine-endopeptidase [Candidatus Eremiobacteraeota bacterium]